MLYKAGQEFTGIEIKAASTWHKGFKKGLIRFSEKNTALARSYAVYRGENVPFNNVTKAISCKEVDHIFPDSDSDGCWTGAPQSCFRNGIMWQDSIASMVTPGVSRLLTCLLKTNGLSPISRRFVLA